VSKLLNYITNYETYHQTPNSHCNHYVATSL